MIVRILLVICGWSFVVVGGFIAMVWFSALVSTSEASKLALGLLTVGGSLIFVPLISVGAVLLGIDKIIGELQSLNKTANEPLKLEETRPNEITVDNPPSRSALSENSPGLTAKR